METTRKAGCSFVLAGPSRLKYLGSAATCYVQSTAKSTLCAAKMRL